MDLSRNRLTGEVPAGLGDLTGLTHLYLAGNQLSGCLPAGWQSLALVGEDLLLVDLNFCPVLSDTQPPEPDGAGL